MADEADQAQDHIEQQLKFAFMTRQRERLRPLGRCWFCEDALESTMLFCSPDCRDDYDRLQAAKKRNGLKDR